MTASDGGPDNRYQQAVLPAVSRTFALTIPQLPEPLCHAVTNAYLLCRIADAIEDEVSLDQAQVRALQSELIDVLSGREDPDRFSTRASSMLTNATIEAERDLVANTSKIVAVFSKLPTSQADPIRRCVEKMCLGMPEFQVDRKSRGLRSIRELDRYCYVVAGVVGEMLTDLFCDYSPGIARHRSEMSQLASSFGEGLQLTNILKDVWEDLNHDTCWLPADIFEAAGYDLKDISPTGNRDAFNRAIRELVAIAHGHLRNALDYSLFIPKTETGIRKFCLWSIELAVLTLRRIINNPAYSQGQQVKVSRIGVLAAIAGTEVTLRSNRATRLLFDLSSRPLPLTSIDAITVA